MYIKEVIGIIAGLVAFSSYFLYIPSILRGETKPNRTSWWIWGLIGFFIFISYFFSGARGTIWIPIAEATGPLIVGILSIKYGEGGWTRLDKYCLLGAFFGTFIWWLSKSSTIGLTSYLFIDLMGIIPTLHKTLKNPQTENKIAWGLILAGNLISLFAIEKFVFSIVLYPIYMIITNSTIFFTLFKKNVPSTSIHHEF